MSRIIPNEFDDSDYSRLADEDNENDEYHAKVSPIDMWANITDFGKKKRVGHNSKLLTLKDEMNDRLDCAVNYTKNYLQ